MLLRDDVEDDVQCASSLKRISSQWESVWLVALSSALWECLSLAWNMVLLLVGRLLAIGNRKLTYNFLSTQSLTPLESTKSQCFHASQQMRPMHTWSLCSAAPSRHLHKNETCASCRSKVCCFWELQTLIWFQGHGKVFQIPVHATRICVPYDL